MGDKPFSNSIAEAMYAQSNDDRFRDSIYNFRNQLSCRAKFFDKKDDTPEPSKDDNTDDENDSQ